MGGGEVEYPLGMGYYGWWWSNPRWEWVMGGGGGRIPVGNELLWVEVRSLGNGWYTQKLVKCFNLKFRFINAFINASLEISD